jgi:hypothetical protein
MPGRLSWEQITHFRPDPLRYFEGPKSIATTRVGRIIRITHIDRVRAN